jgi:NADH:ubiquinone oxidoreductase subunit 3 (subunit A)
MYRQLYLVRVKGKVIDMVFMRKIVDIRSFSIPYYTPNLIFITFDVHKKFIKLKYKSSDYLQTIQKNIF